MILINFSHPLSPEQLDQLRDLTGQGVERVIAIPVQADTGQPLAPQVVALASQARLTSAEWQTMPLLVVPPSLNFVSVALLAELHGRCGYFPAHLRLRPVNGAVPVRYEIAEILDLQALRDDARRRR
jgi:hypothetical protein